VLEHGADYLFTVKGNHPTVQASIERLIEEPGALFPSGNPSARPGGDAPEIEHPA
jgi:hypothetical protein